MTIYEYLDSLAFIIILKVELRFKNRSVETFDPWILNPEPSSLGIFLNIKHTLKISREDGRVDGFLS